MTILGAACKRIITLVHQIPHQPFLSFDVREASGPRQLPPTTCTSDTSLGDSPSDAQQAPELAARRYSSVAGLGSPAAPRICAPYGGLYRTCVLFPSTAIGSIIRDCMRSLRSPTLPENNRAQRALTAHGRKPRSTATKQAVNATYCLSLIANESPTLGKPPALDVNIFDIRNSVLPNEITAHFRKSVPFANKINTQVCEYFD